MINDPFKYIPPDPRKKEAFDSVARAITHVYSTMLYHMPESRERSLAITKLQECRMWANAGISFHDTLHMGGNDEKSPDKGQESPATREQSGSSG